MSITRSFRLFFRPAPRAGAVMRPLRVAWFWLACGIIGLHSVAIQAQVLETENAFKIKAAFLLNFAKYTEWPPSVFLATNSPVRIGILGEDPFGEIMEATVKGRLVHERSVVIQRGRRADELLDCHIVYVSSSESSRIPGIVAEFKAKPTLLVGDDPDFLNRGGMIHFRIKQGRMGFAVHLDTVRSAGLTVRSRMLDSASEVVMTKGRPKP